MTDREPQSHRLLSSKTGRAGQIWRGDMSVTLMLRLRVQDIGKSDIGRDLSRPPAELLLCERHDRQSSRIGPASVIAGRSSVVVKHRAGSPCTGRAAPGM